MKIFLLILLATINLVILKEKLIDVEYIDQTAPYPTGCESVTTIMCLHYFNFSITVDDFIKDYLDMGDMYFKGNKLFAPHPSDKFIGSPYDGHSYGCYEPVITKALKKYIDDNNLSEEYEIKNLTGVPMDTLIEEYIDKDIPVIFWATMDMRESISGNRWIIPETKEEFTWIGREHCLLLVGYNDEANEYIFNDPWHNNGVKGYVKDTVEQRHKELLNMACAIVKKN